MEGAQCFIEVYKREGCQGLHHTMAWNIKELKKTLHQSFITPFIQTIAVWYIKPKSST